MKRDRGFVQAFLLALAAAVSSAGCLATAFDIPIDLPAWLGAVGALYLLAGIPILLRRRGGLSLLVLDWILLFWLLRLTELGESILTVLRVLLEAYDQGYGWGIPGFVRAAYAPAGPALLMFGVLVGQSVCLAVLRRRGGWLAAGMLILSLAACLVVTDTVPDLPWLFGLLLCMALLLLTENVRSESIPQGAKLMTAAVIPTALALGLLFYLWPQADFQNPAQVQRELALQYLRQLPEKLQQVEIPLPNFQAPKPKVDLAAMASQPELGLPVAEALSDKDGALYLRAKDYDLYTGTSWIASEARIENLSGTGQALGNVVVRELNAQTGILLPAFPSGDTILYDGAPQHPEGESVYQVARMSEALAARPPEIWLGLPEQTALGLQKILADIPINAMDPRASAEIIADVVRRCAEYSRRPGAMPAEETDFALWFLERAELGYCSHFATAAAVLLRAAGIPARYVTGYRIDLKAGETARVTSDQAHAWVEYYDSRTWTWVILDATPADPNAMPEPEFEEPTQPTVPQAQPETQPETAPAPAPQEAPAPVPEESARPFPWRAVLNALIVPALVGAIDLQRLVRIRLRRKVQTKGKPNARALARWREMLLLARLLKQEPPEDLKALAEKAAYSQHSLTKEELARFQASAAQARYLLRRAPWWKRLLYRDWYAVI